VIKLTLILLLLIFAPIAGRQEPEIFHPLLVQHCLEQPGIKGKIEILTAQIPYYLRGDFDGDSHSDYAVAVRGPRTRRNGVLICTNRKKAFILGADNPTKPPFSDMPDDNFVAPHWQVYTKQETYALRLYRNGKLIPASAPKGETIAMIWEDGICLIYWDGTRFRWGCGQ